MSLRELLRNYTSADEQGEVRGCQDVTCNQVKEKVSCDGHGCLELASKGGEKTGLGKALETQSKAGRKTVLPRRGQCQEGGHGRCHSQVRRRAWVTPEGQAARSPGSLEREDRVDLICLP